MKIESGTLILNKIDFEHIQERIIEDNNKPLEALQCELDMIGCRLENISDIQMSLGTSEHLELYCALAIELSKRGAFSSNHLNRF